jgi:hypothetical protein
MRFPAWICPSRHLYDRPERMRASLGTVLATWAVLAGLAAVFVQLTQAQGSGRRLTLPGLGTVLEAYASRWRSSSPPSASAPAAQAASTPRPVQGADGQGVQAGGGLDGQPGGHRPYLLEVPFHVRAAGDGGNDREQVEQAEDDSDGRGGLPQGGGGAEAEQGDQRQVQHRPECGAEHRPACDGERRVAVGRADPVAGQDEPSRQE